MEMRKWEFWSQLFSWAHPVISLQNEEAGTMLSIFFFFNIYLLGCAGSSLWHWGSLIFVAACRTFDWRLRILSCSK